MLTPVYRSPKNVYKGYSITFFFFHSETKQELNCTEKTKLTWIWYEIIRYHASLFVVRSYSSYTSRHTRDSLLFSLVIDEKGFLLSRCVDLSTICKAGFLSVKQKIPTPFCCRFLSGNIWRRSSKILTDCYSQILALVWTCLLTECWNPAERPWVIFSDWISDVLMRVWTTETLSFIHSFFFCLRPEKGVSCVVVTVCSLWHSHLRLGLHLPFEPISLGQTGVQ